MLSYWYLIVIFPRRMTNGSIHCALKMYTAKTQIDNNVGNKPEYTLRLLFLTAFFLPYYNSLEIGLFLEYNCSFTIQHRGVRQTKISLQSNIKIFFLDFPKAFDCLA